MTNRPKTVMIATPMYGGMCTGQYVQGLLHAVVSLQRRGVNVVWGQLMNESLITRGRNELVRMFLEQRYDYLMFIDADIGFTGEEVGKLLDADKDIACGLYPKKEIAWDRIQLAASEGRQNLKDYAGSFVLNTVPGNEETDENGFFEVRHGGTGFMLIKREVFTQLAPHVPQYRTSNFTDSDGVYRKPVTSEYFATSIDATGTLLSEDYHFCELWGKHGGKVYATPFFRLDHIGTHVFTGDIITAGGNIK